MSTLSDTARVYKTVLENRSLRRVLVAFLVFNAQEYAIWIAITLYAYGRGGAAVAGTVAVAQLVPAAICAPLGSVLGDRYRRDRALAAGYVLQALTALVCGLALLGAPSMAVYAAAVLSSCAMTLTRPVHYAILPDLATTPGELTAANSVSSSAEGLGIMAGPLLNAVLLSVSGPAAVLLVFAALIGVAALLTYRLDLQHAAERPSGEAHDAVGEALEGVRALRDDLPAAWLVLFGGAQYLILGMLDIFYAVLAIDVLRVGEEGAGVLAAAVGVGGLLGAVATAVLVGRRRLTASVELAVATASVAIAGLALVSAVPPALLVLAGAGAARTFFDVAARTLLQRSVRADVLSRVFGLQEAMLMIGLAVGSAIAPVFVSLFGQRGAFVGAGSLLMVSALAVVPAIRLLDRRATIPDPERFSLLRSLDLFAPLAQPVLEQLSTRAFPGRADAGEVIIREGDAGDRFYVLTAGQVEVDASGARVAALGPGSYFGEIALLRDIPRTATVRAATDVDLLVLERDDFLDAVTGSRRSGRAADATMARRLAELEGDQRVIEHRERIRWSDVDSYGHVNNAVYLNYLEEARDRWFRDVMGDAFGFVVVRVAIDFRSELSLEDEEVVITCAGTGFGTSSVRTREQVRTKDGRLAAEAESVTVKHDEVTRSSIPLSQEERAVLAAAIAADA